jgi:hypothetical protein
MPIVVHCACGKRLRARDESAGKKVRCSACGASGDPFAPFWRVVIVVMSLASLAWLIWFLIDPRS